jgi:hypothetical protein
VKEEEGRGWDGRRVIVWETDGPAQEREEEKKGGREGAPQTSLCTSFLASGSPSLSQASLHGNKLVFSHLNLIGSYK